VNGSSHCATVRPAGSSPSMKWVKPPVACMLQVAWAYGKFSAGDPGYGLPSALDPLEGWIVTA